MAHVVLIGSSAFSLINFRGDLIEGLIRRGHKVGAVAPSASKDIAALLKGMGVVYFDIPLQRRGLNPLRDLIYLWRLFRLFLSIQPDLVLSYTIKPVIFVSIAARLAGIPYISSMITGLGYTFSGNTLLARALGTLAVYLYKISIRHNNVVFFQNHDDLKVFTKFNLLPSNVHSVVIPGSGVNVKHFSPATYPGQIAFLMIARLVREKGVFEYLEAAKLLRPDYPMVHFRLAGFTGKGTSYISEDDLAEANRAGIVEYLGKLKDVRHAIADCSVYVLPTHGGEGIPRTVLEAMAMGRAVITTNTAGCREAVVDGRSGLLVTPRNVESLVAAMKRLIDSRREREEMGAAGRERAVQIYDVCKVNNLIFENLGL